MTDKQIIINGIDGDQTQIEEQVEMLYSKGE